MTESGLLAQASEGSSPFSRQPSVAISPVWHSNVLWSTLQKSFASHSVRKSWHGGKPRTRFQTSWEDRIGVRLQYHFYEDCLRQIAYGPAEHITVPTLIVQGEQDECVPLHQSRRLRDALGGPKRLDLLPGADHQFSRGRTFIR